jgi:hypothetical protein
MSPHRTPRRRPTTLTSLIALTATLVAASLGLAACGGSSSTTTTTQTTANAAATGATTGTTTTGTTTTGTTTTGTTTTGTTTTGTSPSGATSTGTPSTGAPAPGAATTGTAPANSAARIAAVRTCLSKKGITLGAGGLSGAKLPKGMTRTQFLEALESCGPSFNGAHRDKSRLKSTFDNSRFHAVLARFAACLRQNGVNVGEPNTSGKGPIFSTKGLNTGSPQFKAAATKCRSTLLGALKSNRAHPGVGKAG